MYHVLELVSWHPIYYVGCYHFRKGEEIIFYKSLKLLGNFRPVHARYYVSLNAQLFVVTIAMVKARTKYLLSCALDLYEYKRIIEAYNYHERVLK